MACFEASLPVCQVFAHCLVSILVEQAVELVVSAVLLLEVFVDYVHLSVPIIILHLLSMSSKLLHLKYPGVSI